jgi:pimeloyl-ACP methyl ester carboxylesterase
MGPSRVSSLREVGQRKCDVRTPREDEPNLYDIPSHLSATYRPIPWWINCLLSTASLAIVGRQFLSQFIHHKSLNIANWTVKKVTLFLLRYILLWSAARIATLEGFYPPSRVTTSYLAESGNLPSALSNYDMVSPLLLDEKESIPIGVHYIQYNNPIPSKYAAFQLHHGFGASSLSWLPVLPSLSNRLGARVGFAHDAPGFGFTDRPNSDTVEGLKQYRTENSVGIGLALLQKAVEHSDVDTNIKNGDSVKRKDVAIFGHSMGAKAALLTALACSSNEKLQITPRLVVLVAPALEGVTLPHRGCKTSKVEIPKKVTGIRRWLASFWITWRKIFVDYPFQYVLRQLVCTKNFWRKGLSSAWGDPQRLTDSDVLRFQWPSIGKGWERGLISFARAAQTSDDAELLREVVNLPQTTVLVVYGTKDNVVRVDEKAVDRLKKEIPAVKVLRLEGLGHDPFEEDKEVFLSELEKILGVDIIN